jgi:hypothetical protein
MTDGSRDVLRTIAWLCVFAGVLIAIGTHAYLSHRQASITLEMLSLGSQTRVPHTAEHRRYEVLRAEFQRLSRWPGVVGGAGVTAIGILLLVSPRWWHRDAEKYDIGRVAIMAVLGVGTLLAFGSAILTDRHLPSGERCLGVVLGDGPSAVLAHRRGWTGGPTDLRRHAIPRP